MERIIYDDINNRTLYATIPCHKLWIQFQKHIKNGAKKVQVTL